MADHVIAAALARLKVTVETTAITTLYDDRFIDPQKADSSLFPYANFGPIIIEEKRIAADLIDATVSVTLGIYATWADGISGHLTILNLMGAITDALDADINLNGLARRLIMPKRTRIGEIMGNRNSGRFISAYRDMEIDLRYEAADHTTQA